MKYCRSYRFRAHTESLMFSLAILLIFSSPVFSIARRPHCWVVDTTGMEGESLQVAINASVGNPGIDTVLVCDGTYHLSINDKVGLVVADSIVLLSTSGAARCTLTAMSENFADTSWHVIYLSGAGNFITIRGFTIRDGKANGPSQHSRGGGLSINAVTPPTVDSCIVENNYALMGGGGISASAATIVCCTIQNNRSSSGGNGGGLSISNAAVVNCTILNNFAGRGGGIWTSLSSPLITNNTILGNVAEGDGGGISMEDATPTIVNNKIKGNRANGSGGGGVALWFFANPVLTDNTIENNVAVNNGGGILYGWTQSLNGSTINRCTIINNSATRGGGISLGVDINRGIAEIKKCLIENNTAQAEGGGIYLNSANSRGNITKSTIYNNVSISDGGGICLNDQAMVTIDTSFVGANRGRKGGAFYNGNNSQLTVGRCLVIDNGNLQNNKSGFEYNNATASSYSATYSHGYYNTLQPDTEIYNAAPSLISIQNNFWWDTTETQITSLIYGPNNHTPWMFTFIPGVPGEPTSVDSVRNYANDWVTICNLLNAPDTLYLRIYGQDRNASLREGAIAILKSRIYPTGIAVALAETDTNSGIYQGKAYVVESAGNDTIRMDDIRQTIKVNSAGDTIRFIANIDTSKLFTVYYKTGSQVEERSGEQSFLNNLRIFPTPSLGQMLIRYQISTYAQIRLRIYNIAGQVVKVLASEAKKAGAYQASWDGRDERGRRLPGGVYFLRFEHGTGCETRKAVLLR